MSLDRYAVKALCDAALFAIVNYWPDDPVAPLPDRQLVSNGEVIWDCEQLVVAVERIFGMEGDVSAETYQQYGVLGGFRGLIVAVWLIRCVPDIEPEGDTASPPDAAEIDASAVDILGDAVTVWNLLQAAQERGELASCNGLAFQDWTSAGPMGGFGGGVTRVRMEML